MSLRISSHMREVPYIIISEYYALAEIFTYSNLIMVAQRLMKIDVLRYPKWNLRETQTEIS